MPPSRYEIQTEADRSWRCHHTGKPVGLGRIVRRPQLQHHLLLGSQIERHMPPVSRFHVERVTVLAAEQQLGDDPSSIMFGVPIRS